jgi:hypothetical protein
VAIECSGRFIVMRQAGLSRKGFNTLEKKGGNMELSKVKRSDKKPHWFPFDCESCNAAFDPKTWISDWSLSGELTWTCPKCKHPNYPKLD